MSRHKAQVKDWMTPRPVTIEADASLTHAFNTMQSRGIRRLPVVDDQGRLRGVITRSDIQQVIPFFREDADRVDAMFSLAGMTVAEVMTRDPISVTPEDAVKQAAKRMIAKKISGLPVVADGKVVGVITESDIFRMVVEEWDTEDA